MHGALDEHEDASQDHTAEITKDSEKGLNPLHKKYSYLREVNVGDDDRVKCARSILGSGVGVTARVVLVFAGCSRLPWCGVWCH